jgi:hypothetical protein
MRHLFLLAFTLFTSNIILAQNTVFLKTGSEHFVDSLKIGETKITGYGVQEKKRRFEERTWLKSEVFYYSLEGKKTYLYTPIDSLDVSAEQGEQIIRGARYANKKERTWIWKGVGVLTGLTTTLLTEEFKYGAVSSLGVALLSTAVPINNKRVPKTADHPEFFVMGYKKMLKRKRLYNIMLFGVGSGFIGYGVSKL